MKIFSGVTSDGVGTLKEHLSIFLDNQFSVGNHLSHHCQLLTTVFEYREESYAKILFIEDHFVLHSKFDILLQKPSK